MIAELISPDGTSIEVEYLEEVRKKAGKKQKDVAKDLKKSAAAVSHMETTKLKGRKLEDVDEYALSLGLLTKLVLYPPSVYMPEEGEASDVSKTGWFLGKPFRYTESPVYYRKLFSSDTNTPIASILVQIGDKRLHNHRLIEKAPEMLKLLEGLRGTFENLGVGPLVAEIDEIVNYVKER